MLIPMAELKSLFRLKNETGLIDSRFCSKYKREKCLEYDYYQANVCNDLDWTKLKSAGYVLIPITEL